MMKKSLLTLLAALVCTPCTANATNIEDNCTDLTKNLATCTPYACTRPDPENPGHMVIHHVEGPMVQDKTLCLVTETMPAHKIFSCKYTTETLAAATRMLTRTLSGNTNVDKDDQALMLAAFQENYCGIFDDRAVGVYHE